MISERSSTGRGGGRVPTRVKEDEQGELGWMASMLPNEGLEFDGEGEGSLK